MSKNSIQVAIKVRPLLRREKDMPCCWRVVDNSIQLIESQSEPFYFDHIFDQDVKNEVIFQKMAKHIVHSGIRGFNGTIFAYGQTSSGKTYTMMGDEHNPGVMVFAAKEIFKEIEKSTDRQFLLRVGYIEIYNEKIYDLLNKKNQDLKIHETATGIVSVNCEENIITCEEDLLHYLCMGNKERTVGETNMNERSSRSHAIFRIIIESRKTDRSEDDTVIQSVLNLVDLAGSERADQTGARGTRLKEGGHINKSLLFLSNVIKRLSEDEDHKYISYRDSKLTRILQASLGGNALTSIICTITPSVVDETQSTLSFAMRAKVIKNKPEVNEIVSDATMMKRLEREIRDLKTRLAEERSKNESQIKVGQLEQRIKTEVLKLITCNSLHNIRTQRERRRRTWCPATSNLAESALQLSVSSALPMPMIASGPSHSLRQHHVKPSIFCTPYITLRGVPESPAMNEAADIQTEPVFVEEEHFEPAELCTFENISPRKKSYPQDDLCKTPSEEKYLRTLSLTPKATASVESNLQIVEHALMELQEFTNLENKIDVQHDTYEALKQKVDALTSRNKLLEQQRLENIEVKDELLDTKQCLADCEKRCADLRMQVDELTSANHESTSKVAKYEQQLNDCKLTIEKLELENREAVSLEFGFQSHKNKARQREAELLEVIAEQDKEIARLKKALSCLSEEDLQRSAIEKGNQCAKCEDLERLMTENEKIAHDFMKLKTEYEQLQVDYRKTMLEAVEVQSKLTEFEKTQYSNNVECNKLRDEITSMRVLLEKVQKDYTQLNCDMNEKTETCAELNRVIAAAQYDMRTLQEKYDKLEITRKEQQQTLAEIQIEYNAIQLKYQCLQTEYENLEQSSAQPPEDYAQLQKENEKLQAEIGDLKMRIEEAEEKLHESACDSLIAKELSDVRLQNAGLQEELRQLQQQFDDMQKEYNDLSNELMDSLQEGETLRNQIDSQCKAIKAYTESAELAATTMAEKAALWEATKKSLETEIAGLKLKLSEFVTLEIESTKPSDVYAKKNPQQICDEELLRQFEKLAETLQEIEIECGTGKGRLYSVKELGSAKGPVCKLLLRNIEEVVTQESIEFAECDDRKILMQGQLKRHSFHIVEMDAPEVDMRCDSNMEAKSNDGEQTWQQDALVEELKRQVNDLTVGNEYLTKLLESTERTIGELREQINTLSAELLEKSQVLEKCACEDYQKQIECLERTLAEKTILDIDGIEIEKRSSDNVDHQANETLCENSECEEDESECDGVKNTINVNTINIQSEVQKMEVIMMNEKFVQELQTQCHLLQQNQIEAERKLSEQEIDHERKLSEVEASLMNLKEQLSCKEKECTEERNRLQLELYEKLEISENEFRDNLRKYNQQWEEGKETYERTIADLREELKKMQTVADELKDEDEKSVLRQELENAIRDNSKLVQELAEVCKKLEQLEGDVCVLEYDKKVLERERDDVVKRKEELDKNHKVLQSEHDNLKSSYNILLERQTQDAAAEKEFEESRRIMQEQLQNVSQERDKLMNNVSVLEEKYESVFVENCKLSKERELWQVHKNLLDEKQVEMQGKWERVLKEKDELLLRVADAIGKKEIFEKKLAEVAQIKSSHVDVFETLEEQPSIHSEDAKTWEAAVNALESIAESLCIEKNRTERQLVELLQAKEEVEEKSSDVCKQLEDQIAKFNVLAQKESEMRQLMNILKLEYESSLKTLQEEMDNLKRALEDAKQEKLMMEEREQTIQFKIQTLSQELHEAKLKAQAYKKSLNDQEDLEKQLLAATNEKYSLMQRVQGLEIAIKEKNESEHVKAAKCESQEVEIIRLQEQLRAAVKEKALAMQQQLLLETELQDLRCKMNREKSALERQVVELESSMTELQLKVDTLLQSNSQLQQTNQNLQTQLRVVTEKHSGCEKLEWEIESLQSKYSELQTCMEATVGETVAAEALRKDVVHYKNLLEQKTEICERLRTLLDTKETYFKEEKFKLESTISCLLLEKKNTEEKLHNTELILKKLESDSTLQRKSDSVNNSMESNASVSPRNTKSSDRLTLETHHLKPKNLNFEEKLCAERKNRRLSTHDERRRQSLWGATRDKSTMTDPSDTNCNCFELDRKLKECEKNLFIRESQVTALHLEMKNHPLKTENATLKKRLQEEQDRCRIEIKRYKQMLADQASRTKCAVDAASAAIAVKRECPSTPRVNTETQTESDLEAELRALQNKYTDLISICRQRYNVIKDLEEKVAQKENTGGNVPISSLEAGKVQAQKSKCEALEKDIKIYKQKYEDAKKVLHARRVEIQRLKLLLEGNGQTTGD